VRQRIASVEGIQKITSSMKMVAAARLGKQERTTIAARPFALSLQEQFLDQAKVRKKKRKKKKEKKKKEILIIIWDLGCGAGG
jgi:F0F1-type ATP synthase gamma subunit